MAKKRRPIVVNVTADRYKPESFIQAFVEMKFFLFEGTEWNGDERIWMLYEVCPEEGPKIRKKIANFKTREDAEDAMQKTKDELASYLNSKFKVVECQEKSVQSAVVE